MRHLVLFYSRTGTTARIAEALGAELDARVEEIKCPRYQSGWFSYLRAGYDSVKGRLPEIDSPQVSLKDYGMVILGAPVWTSYPAVPLRSFLAHNPDLPPRIAVFMTHGAHSPPDKALEFAEKLLPSPLVASLMIRQDDVLKDRYSEALAAFVAQLNAPG